jgi:hypothetical protein
MFKMRMFGLHELAFKYPASTIEAFAPRPDIALDPLPKR